MMKIGVSSYSFNPLVVSGVMPQLEIISKAHEMGFDAIEFANLLPPEGISKIDFANQIAEEAARIGIPILCYAVAADFLKGSGGDFDTEIERVREEVRIAKIIGVPSMRHDVTRGFPANHPGAKSFATALPRLTQACLAITEFAAEQGIRTMVENHGYFCQDSERVESLICAVNHPNFGALVDVGNFLFADEAPDLAMGRLMPYAFHVHAKDFHRKLGTVTWPGKGWYHSRGGNFLRGAIVGHGDVPLANCHRVMRNAGYEGPLSIEFEGIEEPLEGIALGLEFLRRLTSL
jgi:sugar phosphate isomerase/epimerase